MVQELTDQGLLSSAKVTVGVFITENCAVCKSLAGKISKSVGDSIDVYLIDYEKYPLLFKTFGIDPEKIVRDPVAIVFVYGKEFARISKGLPQSQIAKLIIKAKKVK